MMPGVVAGFPSKDVGITIIAEYSGPDFGGYIPSSGLGMINPPGASSIPGAPAVVGAAGEILTFYYERYEGVTHRLYIDIRGSYPSAAPFTGVSIDGAAVISGWSRQGLISGATRFFSTPPTNPLAAGSHALEFV